MSEGTVPGPFRGGIGGNSGHLYRLGYTVFPMAEILCPECGKDMQGVGAFYTCPACGVDYEVAFTCAECGSVPEELAGCGSVGYLCRTCNAPRSRSSMNKSFRRRSQ